MVLPPACSPVVRAKDGSALPPSPSARTADFPSISLFARLLVLVLLTALPPLALLVWREAYADREHRAGLAAAARDLTLRTTVEQERMIGGAG
ncbi:hypothetical protein E2C06_01860 [Dankookia rubra]|uniref:Uncharacterized protein n=1 Tax=Dankookia rubra TaxID=1442381 RepID=A0A4R5QML7_9PROT|nr:hypothetical protein [Dankookia rubra]TDH64119.1 hypothetical protein E2C06_01860 [Dankookia rubra]